PLRSTTTTRREAARARTSRRPPRRSISRSTVDRWRGRWCWRSVRAAWPAGWRCCGGREGGGIPALTGLPAAGYLAGVGGTYLTEQQPVGGLESRSGDARPAAGRRGRSARPAVRAAVGVARRGSPRRAWRGRGGVGPQREREDDVAAGRGDAVAADPGACARRGPGCGP